MAFVRHNNNGNNGRRHNNNYGQQRHRHHNNGGSQNGGPRRPVNRINHVFESNGPEGRVRGTAQQIVEKYLAMARDAQVAGDKVLMMNYFQHAEHYQRLHNEILEESGQIEREREQYRQQQQSQPDLGSDADQGFAPQQSSSTQQQSSQPDYRNNQPQNYAATPSAPTQAPAPDGGADYTPRRQNTRQHQPRQDEDDLDNALPSFLHVPIPAAPAAPAQTEQGTDNAAAPARARPGRPRRAPALAADSANGDETA